MKKEKSNAAKDSLELLLIVPGKVPAERSPETSTPWAVTMRLLLFHRVKTSITGVPAVVPACQT